MIRAERKYIKLKQMMWYLKQMMWYSFDLYNKYCTGMTFFQRMHLKIVKNRYNKKLRQYRKIVKPCYQCGDLARVVKVFLEEKYLYYSVECEICEERTILCDTKREALAKWNSGDEHYRVIGK